jgi:predicted O-linked N-acetylglucosamine transferase (SPINDLY family)
MATIPEALAIAVEHHQAGRLQAAEQIYRQILAIEPNQVDVIHRLGVLAHQLGRHEEAVECIERAIVLNGNNAAFHSNLGTAYRALRKMPEAVACCRRAIELKPDFAEAHNNLGNALGDQGKLQEAVACYRRAVELNPGYAEAHNNLGNALQGQGNLHEAVACYGRAVELKPGYAAAHNNLGNALRTRGNLDEAVASFRRGLELKPDFAEAHNNLGNVRQDQGKLDDALICYRRAVELKPEFAEAYNNLGNALGDQGNLDDALACFRRALELQPDYAEAHNNLGNILKDQGQPDEAVACYRRAVALRPDYAGAHSNLLLAMQYCAGVTEAGLAEAHAQYDRQHAASLRGAVHRRVNVLKPGRRLRLGFVSPDLRRHPVGYFLVRALENLRSEHETICYSDRIVKDDMTQRLQAAATCWRDVYGISDQRLDEQIRADQVEILFDLAGHTAQNRLLVFARKPAPIQVTWAGYVGATGLTAMDYLLADRYEVPLGSERHYQEQVLRMPDGYICYDPPAYAPPPTSPPALQCGQVTFGCFNKPAKITPQAVEVWSRILRRLPGARLVLKYRGWNDRGNARRFTELFAAQKVDPARLQFLGPSRHSELLAEYHRIDLALDPFPYGGGLTTCEALWMGVPVITCPGETFAGRHSLSHLSNVGLTETIARDLDEYVELAVVLAGDLPRLAALRAGLRDRMAASPLCDGKRFAANLTAILQAVSCTPTTNAEDAFTPKHAKDR